MLGKTEHGEEVWLSRRAAESDLLIYLNINLVPMDGGHKSVAVGLAPYQSLRHHHNRHAARLAFVYGPDALGAASHRRTGWASSFTSRSTFFQIETAVNNADVRRDARLPA